MFTVPSSSSGGIILVARPSASTGTITNPTNAYDLPSGRPDDYPYLTSADRATVTGSVTPGIVDYDIVEFNTFPSRSKSNFTNCNLSIVLTAALSSTVLPYPSGGILTYPSFVTSSIDVQYQIDGSTWITLKTIDSQYNVYGIDNFYGYDLGQASNGTSVYTGFNFPLDGTITTFINVPPKYSISTNISSKLFPSNLNSLKVRFRLGTCTNSSTTSYKSSGSYSIWDIRANLT